MNNPVKYKNLTYILIILSFFFIIKCSDSDDSLDKLRKYLILEELSYIDISRENTFSGSKDYEYYMVDTPGRVDLNYTLNLGSYTKNVYFIFSNINPSVDQTYPIFSSMNQGLSQGMSRDISPPVKSQSVDTKHIGQRGKPEISEFNRDPYPHISEEMPGKEDPIKGLLSMLPPPSAPLYDIEGGTLTFHIDESTDVDATCRKVVSDGTKTLNIWVADDCWHIGGTKAKLITGTPGMVAEMQNKFLKAFADNDIYDWVSNIFGEEWGSHSYSNLISDTITNDEITILLFDIDDDNSINGGVLGYFWSKDNYKTSSVSYSNERIMFYIDAVLYATEEGGDGWQITDYWPSEMISTLGHELQHMIHFYQKNVLRAPGGVGSDIWMNEMCSLVTEDLIAKKLVDGGITGLKGPRGVDGDVSSAGSSDNTNGRLPMYNYYNEASVTTWYSGSIVLISYAINYAFGAYLARNFGGAQFFKNVVKNSYTDYSAIEYALDQSGSSDSFGTALRKWGIANLVSDKTDTGSDYKYNNGVPWPCFQSTIGSIDYELGSINLYYYDYNGHDGPYFYDSMPSVNMPSASNIYYIAGENLTGSHTWNIRMKEDVRLSVVVREDPYP